MSTSSSDPLAPHTLAAIIASSLPSASSPSLKNAYDAVAIAAHSAMLSVGFRLIGLGEDHRIDAASDSSHPSSLPSEWNASQPNYAFRYAHSQSSMEYLLKINRMGNKAVVLGMGLGDDKTNTFDIKVADYVSESSLPANPPHTSSEQEQTTQAIIDVFISSARLADFAKLFRLNIIQKLIPGLQKEGYEEHTAQSTSSAQSQHQRDPERPRHDPLRDEYQPPARPHPLHDPLAQPRRPFPAGEFAPPGFEDPYEMTRPPRPMAGTPGFGNIGERDLYPQGLGPRDGLWGGLGPGLGGGIGGGIGGGGMHPTFDDPLFAGQGRGNGQYDPQAPPGSRYDPVGPGGAPRGSGYGPGGNTGGRPPNPFGGFGSGDFI